MNEYELASHEKRALERAQEALAREKQALEQTRDALLREKQTLEHAVSGTLVSSRSWRMTAPLRYLVGLFKAYSR